MLRIRSVVDVDADPAASDVVATLRAAGCVFAEDEARLILEQADGPADVAAMVARRTAGVPLEQVLGWAEFCGLRVLVAPGVFVPRTRTGFLVELAAELLRPGRTVVDLCCGTGAVGLALSSRIERLTVAAADLDPAAVACARRNLVPAGAEVYAGDLFGALPETLRGRVNVVAVNAPYVPTDEIELMPREAREHEATIALDGGADGVAVHRRVAADVADWLVPGGHVLIETSRHQAELTADALSRNGFSTSVERSDDLDATVVVGSTGSSTRP